MGGLAAAAAKHLAVAQARSRELAVRVGIAATAMMSPSSQRMATHGSPPPADPSHLHPTYTESLVDPTNIYQGVQAEPLTSTSSLAPTVNVGAASYNSQTSAVPGI